MRKPNPDTEIAFMPARVVLQDFTGVPCVVDLAAMRDAVVKLGGKARSQINPLIPVGTGHRPLGAGRRVRQPRRAGPQRQDRIRAQPERYSFLRWGQKAFDNFKVVPPNTGIVHQVNLEHLARVVMERDIDGDTWAFPDTVVGTDSTPR
jgi:aconitate hydratase